MTWSTVAMPVSAKQGTGGIDYLIEQGSRESTKMLLSMVQMSVSWLHLRMYADIVHKGFACAGCTRLRLRPFRGLVPCPAEMERVVH